MALETTLRSNTADAHVRADDADYTTVHGLSIGNGGVGSGAEISVGQSTGFTIFRGCLFFDLSSLGAGVTVLHATVTITCKNDFSTTDFTMRMVDGTAVGVSIGTDDYGILGDAITSIATTITTDTWTGTKTFVLNSLGRAVLSGSTANLKALGIRSEEDINSDEPTTAERANFATFDAVSESDRPLLTLTYLAFSNAPTVTTQNPTSFTDTTATGNGTIVDVGLDSVSEHGIVWTTSTNPTISGGGNFGAASTEGAGSAGVFSSAITGLTSGTRYHVRAYATNSSGTSYGANIIFYAGRSSTLLKSGHLSIKGTRLQYGDYYGTERYNTGTPI